MDNVYNYYALVVAILNDNYTVETAISVFSPFTEKHRKNNPAEAQEMARLRDQEGLTYREIGKRYGMCPDSVYHRIKRLRG
jgi:predicted DNA-binding protein (UPF0251 family)